MKTISCTFALCLLVALVGCESTPTPDRVPKSVIPRTEHFEAAQLAEMSLGDLAALFHKHRFYCRILEEGGMTYASLVESYTGTATPEALRQVEEAMLAHGLPAEDLASAQNGHLRIGMTTAGMVAAWGKPKARNRTTTGVGERVQYVFSSNRYAYTTNGLVTAWQD